MSEFEEMMDDFNKLATETDDNIKTIVSELESSIEWARLREVPTEAIFTRLIREAMAYLIVASRLAANEVSHE